jgi:hypothetical protein
METAVMYNVSKSEAEVCAEKERKEGKNVRILSQRHGNYIVYVER